MLLSQQPIQSKYGIMSYIGMEEIKLLSQQSMQIANEQEYCFVFVLHQKVMVTIVKQELHTINKAVGGELFLIPPSSISTLNNNGSQQTELVLIRFRCDSQSAVETLPYRDSMGLKLLRLPQARSWLQDFQSDCGPDDIALYYQLQSQLNAMVAALIQSVQQPRRSEADLIRYIEQVKQFMIEQLSSPMDMEELALSSGVSTSRFYQAFRSYTGLTPLKYMTKIRLDASMRLLSGTDSSIVDVAHAVGYPDEFYFSRLFKKHMGLAPTEYAQLAQKRVATLVSVFSGDLLAIGMTTCLSVIRMKSDQHEKVLHQLRETKPDLILTGLLDKDMYEACSAIAPVLMLDWKAYSWKERLIDISEHLGLSTVASRWLTYFEVKLQNARAQRKSILGDEPILLVHVGERGFRIFGPLRRKMKDFFYDDLQMKSPKSACEIGIMDTDSLDEIDDFDCNMILFLVPAGASQTYCNQLEDRWRRLRHNDLRRRCIFIEYNDRLNYNPTVHDGLLDETVRHLLSDVR